MNTKEFVTYVKRIAPAWSRPDILEFAEIAQGTVLSVPVERMRFRVEGKDPILTTVAGQHRYELSSSNFGEDIAFIGNVYPVNYYTNHYGKTIADPVMASTTKASGNTNAIINFVEDPGDAEFYIKCYRRPKKLLSEAIDFEIPDDQLIPGLMKGVIGLIETAEHGTSNAYAEFLKVYMPDIRHSMNDEGHTTVFLPRGGGY